MLYLPLILSYFSILAIVFLQKVFAPCPPIMTGIEAKIKSGITPTFQPYGGNTLTVGARVVKSGGVGL